MEFCPKCGSLLVKRKTKFGCPRCNYTAKGRVKLEMKEEMNERREVMVVDNRSGEVLPKIDRQCKKCKSKKAYFWTQGTGDESDDEVEFFRCVKCGHTERADD